MEVGFDAQLVERLDQHAQVVGDDLGEDFVVVSLGVLPSRVLCSRASPRRTGGSLQVFDLNGMNGTA